MNEPNEQNNICLLYPKQKFINKPVALKMVLLNEKTGMILANIALYQNQHINDIINEALTDYVKQFE